MARPPNCNYSKEVIRIDKNSGEETYYINRKIAALDGFNVSKIGNCCKNTVLTYKGFFWIYKDSYYSGIFNDLKSNNKKPHRIKSININNMKFCTKCNIEQDLINFGKTNKGKFDRHSHCKKCRVEYNKNRRKTDKLWQLKVNLRCRLNESLKVKRWNKRNSFKEYIGCSQLELKVHLESQFVGNMSWDNYGKWHIDHIIPLSSAKSVEEMYGLSHYTNLQPLWAIDNIIKGDKI